MGHHLVWYPHMEKKLKLLAMETYILILHLHTYFLYESTHLENINQSGGDIDGYSINYPLVI